MQFLTGDSSSALKHKWTTTHPHDWSTLDVLDWVYSFAEDPEVDGAILKGENFSNVNGRELCEMSIYDFCTRDNEYGSLLHSKLCDLLNSSSPASNETEIPDEAVVDIKNINNELETMVDSATGEIKCKLHGLWYSIDCQSGSRSRIPVTEARNSTETDGNSLYDSTDSNEGHYSVGSSSSTSSVSDTSLCGIPLTVIEKDYDLSSLDDDSLGYCAESSTSTPVASTANIYSASNMTNSCAMVTENQNKVNTSADGRVNVLSDFNAMGTSENAYSDATNLGPVVTEIYNRSNMTAGATVNVYPKEYNAASIASSRHILNYNIHEQSILSTSFTNSPSTASTSSIEHSEHSRKETTKVTTQGSKRQRRKQSSEKKSANNRGRKLGQRSNTIHLAQFLHNMLTDPNNNETLIRWENEDEGVFKIVKSRVVAQKWGEYKGNPTMCYENFSRSIRYCRTAGDFEYIPKDGRYKRNLTFKFGQRAKEWQKK